MDKLQYSFKDQASPQTQGLRAALLNAAKDEPEKRRWRPPADTIAHLLALTLALLIAVYAGMLFERFKAPGLALRHLAALPSCTTAYLAGVAPATRLEPGYWSFHDPDGNGIACE